MTQLDPIYFNATRKLEALKSGVPYVDLVSPPKIPKPTAESYKTIFPDIHSVPRIGVYKNLVIGHKGQCYYCEDKNNTNKDHFYPKSLGGVLIVHSCFECNHFKGNLVPSDFIKKVKYKSNYKKIKKNTIIHNTSLLLDRVIFDNLDRPLII